MTLKVIGTGFGRTGTDSMREALTILGFGPCHHMLEVIGNPAQTAIWRAVASGERPGWDQVFDGYDACVDWPSAHYWRELIEAYPQAKVLLTWRPAEDWWASFDRTIATRLRNGIPDPESFGRQVIEGEIFGGRLDDREHCISVYEANVAAVRATVPAERLLIFQPGDGWAPLCAHLGVPVPDQPFPHRNSTATFRENHT